MEDKRLIFLEAIKPFLTDESYKDVQINIDFIESRLASEGYWGRYTQSLQNELNQLKGFKPYEKDRMNCNECSHYRTKIKGVTCKDCTSDEMPLYDD